MLRRWLEAFRDAVARAEVMDTDEALDWFYSDIR